MRKSISSADFLSQLEEQAELQSRLHDQRIIPSQLDPFTAIIGNFPWQSLLILSGISATIFFVMRHL
jgi:hypothetical protein